LIPERRTGLAKARRFLQETVIEPLRISQEVQIKAKPNYQEKTYQLRMDTFSQGLFKRHFAVLPVLLGRVQELPASQLTTSSDVENITVNTP
jgi:hypothetical protein